MCVGGGGGGRLAALSLQYLQDSLILPMYFSAAHHFKPEPRLDIPLPRHHSRLSSRCRRPRLSTNLPFHSVLFYSPLKLLTLHSFWQSCRDVDRWILFKFITNRLHIQTVHKAPPPNFFAKKNIQLNFCISYLYEMEYFLVYLRDLPPPLSSGCRG